MCFVHDSLIQTGRQAGRPTGEAGGKACISADEVTLSRSLVLQKFIWEAQLPPHAEKSSTSGWISSQAKQANLCIAIHHHIVQIEARQGLVCTFGSCPSCNIHSIQCTLVLYSFLFHSTPLSFSLCTKTLTISNKLTTVLAYPYSIYQYIIECSIMLLQ